MLQVELNKKNANPFYGMRNTLEIFQNGSKGMNVSTSQLNSAWNESKTPEQKAVLFSVLFSIGDVTSRQHNIFESKVDNGGNAQREVFRDNIIPFLVQQVKGFTKKKRLELMSLITEYTTLDNIVAARVKTQKNTKKVVGVTNMISVFGEEDVASYVAKIILSGTVFEKICVAKFVTRPRFSKRTGKKEMLKETKEVMTQKARLIRLISDKAKLPYEVKENYIDFTGFYNWRKEFNQDFESVVFSTNFINTMDKDQFINYIDKIPSDARFRVRNRVMFGEKWTKFGEWFKEWEKYKENKQQEQRILEAKIDQGTATTEDKIKLKQVKKEAKVNTGAESFTNLFQKIVTGTVDELKIQPFLDKVNLPYNTLVFVDDSGSMDSRWSNSELGFTARQMAAFIATIVLSKNPDADARDIIGLFSANCRMFNGINTVNVSPNSLLKKNVVKTAKSALIVQEDSFLQNLKRMKGFLDAQTTGNGTNVSSIPENLNEWVKGDSNRLEELQKYPVWTLISDGNFNNYNTSEASMNDFMRKCENYFGFRPFLILIDVAGNTSTKITQFTGIDNIMMIPPNPAAIEMFLTNFKDMDTYDVYTPLLSLSRSNRYAPVRKFIEE